jgi:hypothetical protein
VYLVYKKQVEAKESSLIEIGVLRRWSGPKITQRNKNRPSWRQRQSFYQSELEIHQMEAYMRHNGLLQLTVGLFCISQTG